MEASSIRNQDMVGDLVPRPDPTALTTIQIDRALAAQRAVFDAKHEALIERVQRLEARVDQVPVDRDHEIANLTSLINERFRALAEAALAQSQTSQLAIDKTERSQTAALNKQSELVDRLTGGLDTRITDLTNRVTRTEGVGTGHDQSFAWAIAAIGGTGGALAIIFAIARAST